MEPQSQFQDTTNTFSSVPSMEYSAEYIQVPVENHAHTIQYESYPSTFGGYDMNTAYLGGMDATSNIVDENFLYDNSYLPYEEYVSSDSDDGEYNPPENFNYNHLNSSYQYEWHQDDFYNGSNLEYVYTPQYSNSMANCTSYFQRGTMYFIPFRNASNAVYTGQATYTQSQPGPTTTVIQLPDVVQVEAVSESTCTENSNFTAVNIENCQETIEAEILSTESTNTGSPQETANIDIPNINYANKMETPKAEIQSTEATIAKSPLKATNAEIPNIDYANKIEATPGTTNAESPLKATKAAEIPNSDSANKFETIPGTNKSKIQSTEDPNTKPPLKGTNAEILSIDSSNKIETMPGTTKAKLQSTEVTNAKSPLKAKNVEIPNIDNTNKIKTLSETTKAETISERDVSELANTLSDYTISNISNSAFRPNASNSNCQSFDKDTNNTSSLNSDKLSDLQNNGERNSCERIDKDRNNFSHSVENRGQWGRNRKNRGNSHKVSGNKHQGDNIVYNKSFNSKRSYHSSPIAYIPNNSFNAKLLNDRNCNNGLENAGSINEPTGSLQGNRRNNENSDVARSQTSPTSSEVCNKPCSVHCENPLYRRVCEKCKGPISSSEASEKKDGYSEASEKKDGYSEASEKKDGYSETSEKKYGYSAAVKRSLNYVH